MMDLGSLTFFSIGTVWQFFLSGVALWVSCYLPGKWILDRLTVKISVFEKILASFFLGLALFSWQAYVFAWLHIRFMGWIYLLVWLLLAARDHVPSAQNKLVQNVRSFIARDWQALVLTAIGVAFQMIFVFGSGWETSKGIRFWFLNAFDGVMHLAFSQQLMGNFPPMQPGANGLGLTHYHYWADLIGAEFSRLWGISLPLLTFQVLPLILAILGSGALYVLARRLGGSRSAARWLLFFHFFSGNLLWAFMLLFQKSFGMHLPAIDHGVIQFANTPQAFAKFIFLSGLWWCVLAWQQKKPQWLFFAAALFSSLFGFKVYFGIFAVLGWSFVLAGEWLLALWNWRGKAGFVGLKKLLPFWETMAYTFFGVLSLAVYLPANASAGGLFYVPLAWPKLLIAAQYLNWQEWWLRRQVYEQYNNIKWLIILDLAVISIFLIGVFGTRLLGFWAMLRVRKQVGWRVWFFLAPTAALFIFTGMNFLQTSGEYNVFNFFVVALLPLTLFLALWLGNLKRSFLSKVLFVCIILLSFPRPIADAGSMLIDALKGQNSRVVTAQEQQMHVWIRENTSENALVQTHPMHEMDRETPWTPYFSQRKSYLAGTGILRSHNQPVAEREALLKKIVQARDTSLVSLQLRELGVEYLLLEKNGAQALWTTPCDRYSLKLVFENERWQVWQTLPVCDRQVFCGQKMLAPGTVPISR